MERKERKPLTGKQKALIIIAAVVLAIAVALAISLPLTLIPKSDVPVVTFDLFDKKNDSTVVVNWTKVGGTKKYYIEYCYGPVTEENTVRLTSERNTVSVLRQKGILGVRVRGDGAFSEWAMLDVPEIKLKAPASAAISTADMKISWTPVIYDYLGARTEVSKYACEIAVQMGKEEFRWALPPVSKNEIDLADYMKVYVSSRYHEGLEEWQDVKLTVKINALTLPKFSGSETDAEMYLKHACADGDEIEISAVITKEIYEGLK